MSDLYERMKARGVDMSWYEKGKHRPTIDAIPLDDEECSIGSIYLLKANGELWTIHSDGGEYKKVRPAVKEVGKSVYLCLHCKAQFKTMPASHEAKEAA